MILSASIPQLKRKAKLLARRDGIPLHKALDRVAAQEGFSAWSLLVSRVNFTVPAVRLYEQLSEGDLLLVGSPPGQGKTLMGMRLAMEAMSRGHRSMFFTLAYTDKDVTDCFNSLGAPRQEFSTLFEFDGSDDIDATYIVRRLAGAPRGTLVVIDYMQLLDQKRGNPELMSQIEVLRTFARDSGLILILLSQIDRSYDPNAKPCPDLSDVRLPNPVDLKLFTKACFLNKGEVRFQAVN